jgi:endonuclease NucS-like protein
MNPDEIVSLFNNFRRGYDAEAKDALWQQQSKAFREFWTSKVMGSGSGELPDSEIDEIVRILDSSGKGNTKASEAVARAMIPQGAWRRMFNQIKKDSKLAGILNAILLEEDRAKRAASIDQLYKSNEKNKNNLTGKSGSAIGVMLAAWDPKANLSIASLNDRRRVLEFFHSAGTSLDGTIGTQIVRTNDQIIESLKAAGVNGSARTVSVFLYSPAVKPLWKPDEDIAPGGSEQPSGRETEAVAAKEESATSDRGLFYLEEELENFLIRNWDQTELGKRYDLIEENGEMVSQQYATAMGPIDILVQDKKTQQYVVIELKRDQTSDQTVGQLARYMGWLEENKTKGNPTKGIIIAGKYDKRLYYALKKLKDAEVYLYQVDFKLNEFKEH